MGDPHVKISNLDEMENLMYFINDLILKESPDRFVILGDLFHTHAILRMEILDFWDNWLDTLSEAIEVFVLIGNHDLPGSENSDLSSLKIFNRIKKRNLKIIDTPRVEGIYGYCPYIHDNDKFIAAANHLVSYGAKVLICHQTFNGSTYENGFFAPDGIDQNALDYKLVISGHIHKRQRFGKIIYPGTSSWQSNSDANEEKGLWLVEDDANGQIISEKFIDTSSVCTPILGFQYKEGDASIPVFPPNAKVTMELIGSSVWVASQKEKFKGKCSIKTKITDKRSAQVRKSGDNFGEFMSSLFVTTMDRNSLLQYAKEIGIV